MEREQVVKKLREKLNRTFADAFSSFANDEKSEYDLDRATKLSIGNVSALRYSRRDNYFANGRGTCGLSIESMDGHSYGWWKMVKQFTVKGKKVVVLNNYRYSQQTAIHIRRASDVLDDLGVKYITLEAPRGLQDLDAAMDHALGTLASRYIGAKYAREKSTESQLKRLLVPKGNDFRVLAMLGLKVSKKMIKDAVESAEKSRVNRLKRQAQERAEKRAMETLELRTHGGEFDNATDGIHVLRRVRNGVFDTINSTDYSWERRKAVRQGLTKLYVKLEIVG